MEARILIKQLSESNHKAFQKLFDIYYPKVKGFLVSLKLTKELDDVLQETFIALWHQRENIDLNKSFDAYLFTIAKNNALKALRTKIYTELDGNYDGIVDMSASTESKIDFLHYQGRLQSSLESLPLQTRKVFELKRVQGMSTKEVAKTLNISPKTVENYMNKALKVLKSDLESLMVSIFLLFFII